MGYVKEFLLPTMSKNIENMNLTSNLFQLGLWYTSTKECYLHRTEKFDTSWLSSPTSDPYVALFFSCQFAVSKLIQFANADQCNDAIDNIENSQQLEDVFYITKSKKESLFFSFWNRIRNALAHGSINKNEDYCYIINQIKPKPDAKINFYIKSKVDFPILITNLWDSFEKALSNPEDFKYNCIAEFLDVSAKEGYMYSKKLDRHIIIDDSFKFTSKKREDSINELIGGFDDNMAADIIINENIGNLSEEKLESRNGNIRVIPQSKIIEYYKVPNILLAGKE